MQTIKFDSLIFDLDGTLWDCTEASAIGVNRAYEHLGVSKRISPKDIQKISGRPANECEEVLLSEIPASLREELAKQFDIYETQEIKEQASRSLYHGVSKGLAMLKKRFALFLVSNCGEEYLSTFLEYSTIGTLFKDSECFGRTGKSKAENIRLVIDRQELKAPCYIGDTARDEEAALKIGIPFFHVQYGFGTPLGQPPGFATFKDLTLYFRNQETLR